MGVAVTIAGGGDGFSFSFFWTICCKKTGRVNEATEAVFAVRNCESCTRPISTNLGSMEAGVYGLMRGMCFVARRLEVVAVAGLCGYHGVFRAGRIFYFLLRSIFFRFILRTHTAYSKYEVTLPHLHLY